MAKVRHSIIQQQEKQDITIRHQTAITIYISTLARYNHYLFRLGYLTERGSAVLNIIALILYFVILYRNLVPAKSEPRPSPDKQV